MSIISMIIDNLGELKITRWFYFRSWFLTLSAVWDIKGFAKSGNITVVPSEIPIGESDDIEEELALTNLNIPPGNSEKRLVITANVTNCTDEETGCNKRFTRTVKRNILIKVSRR